MSNWGPSLIGQRFGRLVVLKGTGQKRYSDYTWECQCDCGNNIIVRRSALVSGHTKSCGCISTTHGMSKTALYHRWTSMMRRCYAPKNGAYKSHGARGIRVCSRWHKFENFMEDMGPTFQQGLVLDRIEGNGNYEPTNCRWATYSEQNRNSKSNHLVEYQGKMVTIAELAEIAVVSRSTLIKRIHRGWSVEAAVSIKVRGQQ